MAKQSLSSPFLNQAKSRALTQLVPKRSFGSEFSKNFGQLRKNQQQALDILGFKDYTGSLGPSDTYLGKGAKSLVEGALNIPYAFGELYKDVTAPFLAGDAGVSTALQSLLDPLMTKEGRRKYGEKMALDTSGFELGLPTDKTVNPDTGIPRGELGPSPILGQSLKEREEEKRKYLNKLALDSEKKADEFASAGKRKKGDPKTDLPGEYAAEQDAIKRAEKEDERETDIASAPDSDLDYRDTYSDEELEEAGKEENPQAKLFKAAMKEIEDMYPSSDKPSGKKTIADYKADFAKATGIDISGEPDNRSALMALGLSLMQNRAGKGFDLSKILGEVGAAGQAALPKFEQARKEARAAQVAAGKYALAETKADTLAELATAKEKRKALAAVSKEFRTYSNQQQLEYIKHNNALKIKELELSLKGVDPKAPRTRQTLPGQSYLKTQKAFVPGINRPVYLDAVGDAKQHADVYVNILEAQGSITEMQSLIKDLGSQGASSALSTLTNRVKKLLKPLGIGDVDYSAGIDEALKKGVDPETKVRILQDRLISQYKKFLTKETGNGVSEGDIKRLKELIAEIKVGTPLSTNLARLEELRGIFNQPQRTLESTFADLANRDNHRNEESYLKTLEVLQKAISTGTSDLYNLNVGDDGTINIDLTKR